LVYLYEFKDYRDFLKARLKEMPRSGYGQAIRIAEKLGVHTTLISQVMKGHKSFTLEQAAAVCEFFALDERETRYFLLLVQIDRAGTDALRKLFEDQLRDLREQATDLGNRLQSKRQLTDPEQAIFYSDWIYSAVRQMIAIRGFETIESISESLELAPRQTKNALEFLLRTGLCLDSNGKLKVGPSATHLKTDSPWKKSHHLNWRVKAIESLNKISHAKLHYSAAMTLSHSDAKKIKEMLSRLLESIDVIVEPSPSQELHCINIDWFKVNK
jgi:uncharacterized protein (TIGR02147 family)